MLETRNNSSPIPGETEITKIRHGTWRTYDATDGLNGQPNHLLQDRDGYLWIGTDIGLCRYDGYEFIAYTTRDGLSGNNVLSLCLDSQGRIWIGTDNGLSCFDGKEFTNYTTDNGLSGNRIATLCVDGQEALWIGTEKGLSRFNGKKFINYTTADGLIDNNVSAICPSNQGGIWIGGWKGISRFDGQQITTITTDIIALYGRAMCEDNQGQLWIAAEYEAKGVYCFDGKRFKNYTHKDGLLDRQNLVHAVYNDLHGRMWFCGWGNASRLDGDQFISYTPDLQNGVFDILEDREGQIWFAHGQLCGLSCYDPGTISILTDRGGGWESAQEENGRIWLGSWDLYGLSIDSESSEVQLRRVYSTKGATVHVKLDSKKRIWFVPFNDGLYLYDSTDSAWESAVGKESSVPRHFKASDTPTNNNIAPSLVMKDGTIWFRFPNTARVSRFDPEQFNGLDENPLESISINDDIMIEDSQGRVWIGGQELSCWNGKELTTYIRKNELPGSIVSMVEDDAGRIWFGTINGISCFDGENLITYGEEYGLKYLHHWWRAVKDKSGQLWFATICGVYRTDGKHFQWLTKDDGLPSNYVSGLLPQPDGSMIICTSKGIICYRYTATLMPKVAIREILADRIYQSPIEPELSTTATNLLTISYHSLSLATHRMRYSYILEGYDKEWHETWELQVRYENLPTGDYTFKVIAINRDLVTSETPATLKLKVIPDPRDVKISILQSEVNNLRREIGAEYDFHEIIGLSDAIKEVQIKVAIAIESGLNMVVLITGETGTGKGLVAEAIHLNSRKGKPKILYNCSRLTRELASTILFGHRKGAFTDAKDEGIGLFEAANGGTLILDEIGDVPFDVQANLLDVLQEHRFSKLGDHKYYDVDVQVIAMTNRDIKKEVDEGRFREDLYYRLNQFCINLPPLRDRPEDIPLLANHFLKLYSEKSGRKIDGFAPSLFEIFQRYSWLGNIRELEEVIKVAVASAVYDGSHIIHAYYFPPHIVHGKSSAQDIATKGMGYRESLDLFKRRIIEDALKESGGNRAEAARMLKMERPNLVELIKRLKIN